MYEFYHVQQHIRDLHSDADKRRLARIARSEQRAAVRRLAAVLVARLALL